MEQIHQEGFHRVVVVVAKRDFVAAKGFGSVVEQSAAHSGAEAARVGLVAGVEDDRTDISTPDQVGNPVFITELLDFGKNYMKE